MRPRQASLGDFTPDNVDDWPPVSRDEWGPTMPRPVPVEEAERSAVEGWLADKGFNLACIREESGIIPGIHDDYHPDDEHREDHHPEHEEDRTRENLAKITQIDENMRHHDTADDGEVLDVLNSVNDPAEFRRKMAEHGEEVVTDGGQAVEQPEAVDPENPPAGETVRLIKGITRVIHKPDIVEGELSSTGKTISVTVPRGSNATTTYRLDAEKILSGDLEVRDATTFEIYTRERYRTAQRSNKQPGPRAGTDRVSDADELPPATHRPPGEDEREQEREERRQKAEQKRQERRDALGFEDVENGARLILDAHAGEFPDSNEVADYR
jgi:hypothetical protein